MLDDNVQPNVRFDLLGKMRVLKCRNAFDRILIIREGLEEAYDALGDTCLLSSLMDINSLRIEKQYLRVRELFFLRLL